MDETLQQYLKYQKSWASWYRYQLAFLLMDEQHDVSDRELRVLDAAAGNGLVSERFLEQGHQVTLYDGSQAMIADAKNRLIERYGARAAFHVGVLNSDFPDWEKGFDLVIMHHIIEYLPDPTSVFKRLTAQVMLGAEMSLITINPVSEVLRRIHFDRSPQIASAKLFDLSYDARWFGDAQLYTDDELNTMLADAGWEVFDRRGMRIFSDYTDKKLSDDDAYRQEMVRLEVATSAKYPYRDIGRYRQWACRAI